MDLVILNPKKIRLLNKQENIMVSWQQKIFKLPLLSSLSLMLSYINVDLTRYQKYGNYDVFILKVAVVFFVTSFCWCLFRKKWFPLLIFVGAGFSIFFYYYNEYNNFFLHYGFGFYNKITNKFFKNVFQWSARIQVNRCYPIALA
ncbi:hypothetical protein GW590_01940 [Rahnella sp. SAP-1]|uniref:Uncharacterized protein n=1 Tax=Rouxiella aceris TaxID=2703884 RepID=A0A848MDA7_9GAMM|nr:hypothetical protein [Rouxiella aceris]NMP25645.1 hypothetical protein [Rouxiella aceris]